MFKKTLHTLLLACILITPLVSKASEDNLYRNEEYRFRIKFPSGWEVMDGDGEHIIQKAVKDGGTVLIQVRDILSIISETEKNTLSEKDKTELQSAEMSDLSDKDAEDISGMMIDELLKVYPGSKIIEKEMRYIDNRKAIYFKINQVYKVQNMTIEGPSINYITIHKGKMYQIGGFYPKDDEYQEPTIKASLATFVFEDWNDPAGVTGTNSTSIDTTKGSYYNLILEGRWGALALVLVAGILFTWGLGLLIPILLRFVFLKRPLSKWASITITGLIWFVQVIIATSLSGKSTGHNSLVLVALVSYWILRLGAVKNVTTPKETLPSENAEIKNSAPDQLLHSIETVPANNEQIIIPSITYCSKCGNKMKSSSSFCSKCGEKI